MALGACGRGQEYNYVPVPAAPAGAAAPCLPATPAAGGGRAAVAAPAGSTAAAAAAAAEGVAAAAFVGSRSGYLIGQRKTGGKCCSIDESITI